MQTPTSKTPITKCLELATYAIRMFGKFSTNVVLTALAAELTSAKNNLGNAQQNYAHAIDELLNARVDVKFENHRSDRRIRQTQQKAELADGKKYGPIATMVFPDGSTPITRLIGDSQVQAMADLQGRLDSAVSLWPDAAIEKAEIASHREDYATALKSRADISQNIRDKRALRNAAKEAFLNKYAEITSRVAAEFPRDTTSQDLFFDDVRTKSALEEAENDDSDASDVSNPPPTPSP